MLTKDSLRKKAKTIRSLLYMSKISENICANFINTEIYDAADHIMLFYPKKDEVDMLAMTNDRTKHFYLPRVEGDKMVVCPYKKGDKLKSSGFGVMEPVCEPVSPDILDIILVPALLVGKNFRRLGYGKGFYDRFFNENEAILKAIRVCPIPSVLTVGNVPCDDNDAVFDIILDEL